MGKIADNAEQQKHDNAAPQQKIFHFAALGEPLGIPQHPNQKCRQPQRREQSDRQIFPGGTEEIQMQQANAKMRDAAARTCQTGDLLEQAGDPQRCQLGDDIIRQPQQKKDAGSSELFAVDAEKETQILQQKGYLLAGCGKVCRTEKSCTGIVPCSFCVLFSGKSTGSYASWFSSFCIRA